MWVERTCYNFITGVFAHITAGDEVKWKYVSASVVQDYKGTGNRETEDVC